MGVVPVSLNWRAYEKFSNNLRTPPRGKIIKAANISKLQVQEQKKCELLTKNRRSHRLINLILIHIKINMYKNSILSEQVCWSRILYIDDS